MEKILRIEEATFKKSPEGWSNYDGWQIITDQQTIKIGIQNGQDCCENWGYVISNDNPDEFIGATINEIKIVDTALNAAKAPEIYEGAAMFVNIETDKGTLQFTTYNEHNGYYGHEAVLISQQLNHEETL